MNMADKGIFGVRPEWVSEEMFPFESRFFDSSRGRMHYIDEGKGTPIVFLHGNPSWSFEFRGVVERLREQYRCIAPDHIGFGLSQRSRQTESYHPQAHAENFAEFMEHLELDDVTLYLTDWGGPIGLAFAQRFPERVSRIIVANTWCWPVNDDRHFVMFSRMMSSPIGQFLIRRFNIFVTQVMPRAVGDRKLLTPEVMRHYRRALPDRDSRAACAAFPGHIIGASEWLDSIWVDRETFINKPALILWGYQDIAFRQKELSAWQAELTNHECHTFDQYGHFLAEEAPASVAELIAGFMESNNTNGGGGRNYG